MMYNHQDLHGNTCLYPCISQLYMGVRLQMFTASNNLEGLHVAFAHLLHRQCVRPHVPGGCVWTCGGERETQGLSNKDFLWMTKTNKHLIHLWVNLYKSFVTALIRSHYCFWWWSLKKTKKKKKSEMMQSTCKTCLCCDLICPPFSVSVLHFIVFHFILSWATVESCVIYTMCHHGCAFKGVFQGGNLATCLQEIKRLMRDRF